MYLLFIPRLRVTEATNGTSHGAVWQLMLDHKIIEHMMASSSDATVATLSLTPMRSPRIATKCQDNIVCVGQVCIINLVLKWAARVLHSMCIYVS